MASLTQALSLSNEAPTQGADIAGNISEGAKVGIQLATAKEQVEATRIKVDEQKMELAQKQAMAMLNRTKAALFSNNKEIFNTRMAANKAYANSLNIPYDDQAIASIYNDDNLRMTAQSGINKLTSGGVLEDPTAVLGTLGNSAELYSILEQMQYANSQAKQKADQTDKQLNQQNAQFYAGLQNQKEVAAINVGLNKEKVVREKGENLDKQVVDLSKRLTEGPEAASLPAILNTLQSIDKMVGGLYEPKAVSNFNKIAGGKGLVAATKIPWTQIAPLENVAIDKKDMPLFQEIAGLRNNYLKLRSGGAVTDPEADRFLQELGQGSVRTGAQLQTGVQRLNEAVRSAVKSKEAGYAPEVVEKFASRGGTINSMAFPQPKKKSGKTDANIEAKKQAAIKAGYSPEEVDAYVQKMMNVGK